MKFNCSTFDLYKYIQTGDKNVWIYLHNNKQNKW